MRVLFSAPPQTGHILPAVPLLGALRAAGHDVLVAGYGGKPSVYSALGLPVVEVGDGMTIEQAYQALPETAGRRHDRPADQSTEGLLRRPAQANALLTRATLEPLLKIVHHWKPDLLLHDPFQGAMPIVAAASGIPSVLHQSTLLSGRVLAQLIADELRDLYAGPPAAPSIEVVPPSLRENHEDVWPVRHIPAHGATTLPADLLAPPARPRVVITFGTVVSPQERDRRLSALFPMLSAYDADFLLPAVEDAQLGAVPANVRPLGWVPISQLLPHSAAIVHHGGAGTLMAAVSTGTPQLVVPHHADQFFNARAVARTGIGLTVPGTDDVTAQVLERLLNDEEISKAAEAMRQENARQPLPSELVERLLSASRAPEPAA